MSSAASKWRYTGFSNRRMNYRGRMSTGCPTSDAFLTKVRKPHPIHALMLINLALRLYPSIPINVRIAKKTTWIPRGGGPDGQSPVLIRKGAGVGYAVYYMHRLKHLYGADANQFRPERWEDGKLADIGWGYLPFSGGPRLCLGSEFFPFLLASFHLCNVSKITMTDAKQRILPLWKLPVLS